MRRDGLEALGDRKAGRAGLDHHGRKPPRSGGFAGAAENHVVIGDAAVRYPGLDAVETKMRIAVGDGRRRHGRRIRACLGLGEREGGDPLSLGDRRQPALLLLFRAEQRHGPRAEPLHGEGEIGEPRGRGQRLAREAKRAHVERRRLPAMRRDHRVAQKARLAERANEAPARGVDVVMIDEPCRDVRARKPRSPRRSADGAPRRRAEQERLASAHQSPSNTGFSFLTKAR